MRNYLQGLSLKNYRGISAPIQRIGPFSQCNFFIGTNNSGKSCVLNFLSKHLFHVGRRKPGHANALQLTPLEIHLGATATAVEVGIGYSEAEVLSLWSKNFSAYSRTGGEIAELHYRKLVKGLSTDGLIWLDYTASDVANGRFAKVAEDKLAFILDPSEWSRLWQFLTGHSRGDLIQHWVPQTIDKLVEQLKIPFPPVKMVPAKRQIGVKGKSFEDFSGAGLIDRLAELQNPTATERHLRKEFEKINDFLREVTGDIRATIEIPHDRDEVLVHKNDRVLPLSSLGTGIHEVVMLAAFCTLTRDSIICMEEPEIHLHPLLQKKLINCRVPFDHKRV